MFVNELENAGATIAVDEEYLTGHRLREAMSALLMPGVEDRGSVETVTQPEL
jgi:hypothetical protein